MKPWYAMVYMKPWYAMVYFSVIYHGIHHIQDVICHGESSFDLLMPHGIYLFYGYMAWYVSIQDGMYQGLAG
jgi:hypothetical protein